MQMTKEAQDAALRKVAAAEATDREQAFEAGFMKAAHDLGLDANDFQTLYAIGVERLTAASKG